MAWEEPRYYIKVRLYTYSKQPIQVVGSANVNLSYKGQTPDKLPLLIVQGQVQGGIGLPTLSLTGMKYIRSSVTRSLRSLLGKYPSINISRGVGKTRRVYCQDPC